MIRRTASKRDANHAEIETFLREIGFSVADTSALGAGFPDLVVAKLGYTILIEIKDGSRPASQRRLTDAEVKFLSSWRGWYEIIQSTDDCLKLNCSVQMKCHR